MSSNVVLTGVTGALGCALLPELIDRGFTVFCLIRPQLGRSARERLAALIRHPRAIAIDGDITRPLCGIEPANLPHVAKLVHAAADTSLSHASEARVIESNHAGTNNVLALAAALGHPDFYYVGTAYIAGDAPELGEQARGEPLDVGAARNPYERSKVEAESAVRGYAGNYSVLRPSIVVGRSDDGTAPLLDGWYGFFRNITKMRQTLQRGHYLDEKGVRIARGYRLQLPIGIRATDDVPLNLIQLDWISQTEAALISLPARDRTYNLTHLQSMRLKDILRATLQAMDANVTFIEDTGGWTLSPIKLAIRRMVNRELEHLRPYLKHGPAFVSRNIYTDLGPSWPTPPAITQDFIRMTMAAAERNWLEPDSGASAGARRSAGRPETGQARLDG